LLQIREGVYETVKEAIDTIEQGGASGVGTAPAQDSAQTVNNEANEAEKTKLTNENKKLNYRVIHLLKALEDLDKRTLAQSPVDDKPTQSASAEEEKTVETAPAEEEKPAETAPQEKSSKKKNKNKKK